MRPCKPIIAIAVLALVHLAGCLGAEHVPAAALPNLDRIFPPDAGCHPVPVPEQLDAGVPPMPPDAAHDAAPEPVYAGPCEWRLDSRDQVADDGTGYVTFNQERPGGLKIGGAGVLGDAPSDSAGVYVDHWGYGIGPTAGIDYGQLGAQPWTGDDWTETHRAGRLALAFPPDAYWITLHVAIAGTPLWPENPHVTEGRIVTYNADQPAPESWSHWLPYQDTRLPELDIIELGSVSADRFTGASVPVVLRADDAWRPGDRWKVRAIRFLTPGPVDGVCPVPMGAPGPISEWSVTHPMDHDSWKP